MVKDPRLDDSLYSATCVKTNDCPSSMVAMVDAASTRTCAYLIQGIWIVYMRVSKLKINNLM